MASRVGVQGTSERLASTREASVHQPYFSSFPKLLSEQASFRPGAAVANWDFGSMSVLATAHAAGRQLQRKCAACQEEDDAASTHALRKSTGGHAGAASVPAVVHSVLHTPGQPLDRASRAEFSACFGADFSSVRVHADSPAAESARAVNAYAYTVGNHIAFASNQYQPFTSKGRALLAHELTHVLQQRGSKSASPMPALIAPSNDAAEQEAERNASLFETPLPMSSRPVAALATRIQRYAHDSSCTDSDLRTVVWPGDARMRTMLAKCIRVLGASPIDPAVAALFPKYFMTTTPDVAKILEVYNAIQTVVTANNYTYECEHDCSADEAAYVRHRLRYFGIDPHIHVCINHMSGYSVECNASLILHELSHYAAHLDDEATGCGACSTAGCPPSLSVSDALDNTYSYADFAYELDPMAV